MSAGSTPILTFGYGKRSLDDCVELLDRHGLEYVVDVRSVPWSRFKPEFSRDALESSLRAAGKKYLFMGDELGGRPEDAYCYDADGRVDYLACRARAAFREGISRLLRASEGGYRIALMCSEGRPEDCHRTKLVGEALREHGVDVQHVDELDELRTHEQVLDRLRAKQLTLLEGDQDGALHKSRGRYAEAARP